MQKSYENNIGTGSENKIVKKIRKNQHRDKSDVEPQSIHGLILDEKVNQNRGETSESTQRGETTVGYKYIDEGRKRHWHELDGKQLIGTTTLINEIFPPPLAYYGSGKALEALGFISFNKEKDDAKRLELATEGQKECLRAAQLPIADYRAWLEERYKAHDEYKKLMGRKGTDIHAEIEEYIRFRMGETNEFHTDEPLVEAFIKWAEKDVEKFLWAEAHCYSKALWVGGITDFGFVHKSGKVIIGDNKSGTYPKHFIQTAGYGIQIAENGLYNKEGIRIIPPMKIDGYMIFNYNTKVVNYRTDIQRLEGYFKNAVDMYNHKELIGTNTLTETL